MANTFMSLTIVLWLLMAAMLLIQWAFFIKEVPTGVKFFIFILVIITAPALIISDIVTNFLDMFFPEGWSL